MARIVVVGAGVSGLTAATSLQASGHQVVVLDKGRGVGGRLATRRIVTPGGDTATFDHGAQFFTARSDEFSRAVDGWMDAGVVRVWCRGFDHEDGHPRYVAAGGMTMLAKHLASSLEVRTSTLVFEVRPGDAREWTVVIDDASTVDCDAVITTCPLLQSYSITVTAGAELPVDLLRADYDRTIGLLAVLDGPPDIPAPGGLQNPDDVFSWIGDNVAKGVSATPAVTFHAGPEWSAAHWDDDTEVGRAALVEAARPYLGSASIIASDYKKWRFATPRAPWPEPFFVSPATPGTLVFAGDAFAGPKVEGAFLSGLAAARHLEQRLSGA